jgi:hypothetical protein
MVAAFVSISQRPVCEIVHTGTSRAARHEHLIDPGVRCAPAGQTGGVMVNAPGTNARAGRRTLVQTLALAVGATFLLVGVLGFIPGITTNYDTMTFAGHESDAKLLGIFEVSILHNIVHLLFGVAGVVMARTASLARLYLIGGGAIYLVLWLYGLVIDDASGANFVPMNNADDWLHFVLGIGMIGLGVLATRGRTRAAVR